MTPTTNLLLIIWLVLGIVFGYFYGQETRKMVIAGIIVVIILLLWFVGPVLLAVR